VRLFALTCGYLTGNLGYLMKGGEGPVELPIPSYLIEHPRGTVLFDTGMPQFPTCPFQLPRRLPSLWLWVTLAPPVFVGDIGERHAADWPEPTYPISYRQNRIGML
jgi:hypothetical protein